MAQTRYPSYPCRSGRWVKPLTSDHLPANPGTWPALNDVLNKEPDYLNRTTGMPPGSSDVQNTFSIAPEGKSHAHKTTAWRRGQAADRVLARPFKDPLVEPAKCLNPLLLNSRVHPPPGFLLRCDYYHKAMATVELRSARQWLPDFVSCRQPGRARRARGARRAPNWLSRLRPSLRMAGPYPSRRTVTSVTFPRREQCYCPPHKRLPTPTQPHRQPSGGAPRSA